jgi:phage shock protein E
MIAGICYGAVTSLSQDQLKEYLSNGSPNDFILIDVRTVEEINAAIGNAKCKPYNLAWPDPFQKEALKIPKEQMVILYCRSGARAASAAAFLDSNGYTNVYNAGGFMTWTGPTVSPSEIKPASLLPELSMRATAKK